MTQMIFNSIDKEITIPSQMGTPSDNQLQGSPYDNLCELAGRVCYDSLGRGRSSEAYHNHIIEVNHGSVQEHGMFTLEFDWLTKSEHVDNLLICCLNIPGLTVRTDSDTRNVRVTCNLRTAREIRKYNQNQFWYGNMWHQVFVNSIQNAGKSIAPLVFSDLTPDATYTIGQVVDPVHPDEISCTFYISDVSRGLTHELVRHKWMTAISQRSTRYVDESTSDWIYHPIVQKYRHKFSEISRVMNKTVSMQFGALTDLFSSYEILGKEIYNISVDVLEKELVKDGVDSFTARKQARAAARGFLGNALSTELILTARLSQWNEIIRQRANNAADAEIRLLANDIYEQLHDRFPAYVTREKSYSPDGIGYELRS